MHLELKKGFEMNKIFFGAKESLKKPQDLKKVFVSSDCREEILNLLNGEKINFELLEFSKEEITSQLELDFVCEVFGLKK